MKSVDHLVKVAERLARKMSLAQTQTLQAGEIAKILHDANLPPSDYTTKEIGPLLNTAGVPENASVEISILVDPRLVVTFQVKTNPPDKSAAVLQRLLQSKYATKMS